MAIWSFFFSLCSIFFRSTPKMIHIINRYLFKSLFLMVNPNIRSSWLYIYISLECSIYIYTRYNGNCMENQLDLIFGKYPTIIYLRMIISKSFSLYKAAWGNPEIGVPPNHPFIDGIFHYKQSICGYPHL